MDTAMKAKALIVDDEELIRTTLSDLLKKEGFEVRSAEDVKTAEKFLEEELFDIALFDLRLPDGDGLSLLRRAHDVRPEMPVLILTAFAGAEPAVKAMKEGAYDYITKPFNLNELTISVKRALETARLRIQVSEQVRRQKERFGLEQLIGSSPAIREIKSLVRKIAHSETTTVLLRGESGTGKDVIAYAIHYESQRAEKPFMNVTCTAIQDTLLESELFGHEKGAFTDAKSEKKGLFELAHGGTVFLDEIGDMSATLQGKLLRVLEEKAFKRVGGTADIAVDVRVVAATNQDLEKEIREKRFREDLFYRLNIIPIHLPPLRERREDIPLLAKHFLETYNREFRRTLSGIDEKGMRKLKAYDWPGNVRELRNVMERGVLLSSGKELREGDLLVGQVTFGKGREENGNAEETYDFPLPPNGCSLEQMEKHLIEQALKRTGGNQTRAADLLGITRDQIRYKVEKFGLRQDTGSSPS